MNPFYQPTPIEVTTDTLPKWLATFPRYPAVVTFQWRDEFGIRGINFAFALAWAATQTDKFSDPRWVAEVKLPDPITGAWPEKGSKTMRAEIRVLADRIQKAMREGRAIFGMEAAEIEYCNMQKACVARIAETRPEPAKLPIPTPTPKPIPKPAPPAPTPRPSPVKPKPKPNPDTEGSKWPGIGKLIAILLPLLTFAIWIAPIPEPIKSILRAVVSVLTGMFAG